MTDFEIYIRYSDNGGTSISSFGRPYKVFNSVATMISNEMTGFLNLEALKAECLECFRYFYIQNVLKSNKLISVSHGGDGGFNVMDHIFQDIDEDIKATNNKAFL